MLMAKRYLREKKIYLDNVIDVTEKAVCMRVGQGDSYMSLPIFVSL